MMAPSTVARSFGRAGGNSVELLPAEEPDSDAFDEELYHDYCQYHASPW